MAESRLPTAAEIERVARKLWGPPNRALSTRNELRFGAKGSKSLDLIKFVWFDHEINQGGGALDLFRHAGEPLPNGHDAGFRLPRGLIKEWGQPTAIFDYHDAIGILIVRVCRFERGSEKTFRQCRLTDGGEWFWKTHGIEIPLYRTPDIEAVQPGADVYLVEGEKKADALAAWGLTASCNVGGAGKFRDHHAAQLAARRVRVIILPDNDPAGRQHAAAARVMLEQHGVSTRTVVLPNLAPKGDVIDWAKAGGTAEQLQQLVAAQPDDEPGQAGNGAGNGHGNGSDHDTAGDDAAILRLAKMARLAYERVRIDEASRLGCRPNILDKLVDAARGENHHSGEGQRIEFEPIEPWPEEVDGAALLDELATFFKAHATLPLEHVKDGLALWVLHCFCFENFAITPRLIIKSIDPQSGKSTIIDLLTLVTPRAVDVESATVAYFFRVIEMAHPTFLLDEADRFLNKKENGELIGAINAGAKRGGKMGRVVPIGDHHEPRNFDVFAPVALAGIGTMPGTIEDRAIILMMKPRTEDEKFDPIDDEARATAEKLKQQAARWCADHAQELRAARPEMGKLYNRAADRWRCLYAIADLAGDTWGDTARATMEAFTAAGTDDSQSLGVKLLADMRTIFDGTDAEEAKAVDEISSDDALTHLCAMADRPWPEMGKEHEPLSINGMTRMLKKYVGKRKRLTASPRPWGYRREDFKDAWRRYIR